MLLYIPCCHLCCFFLEYHKAEETDIGRNVPNKVIMIHEHFYLSKLLIQKMWGFCFLKLDEPVAIKFAIGIYYFTLVPN